MSFSIFAAGRGFCFVKFSNFPVAEICKKILTHSYIEDRILNVSWADPVNNTVDDDVMSTVKTLYVSNLAISIQDDALRNLFSSFGEVAKCVICKNQYGQPRGFAFVEFKERDCCLEALNALNGTDFGGQKISVVLATPPPANSKSKFKNWNKNQVMYGQYQYPMMMQQKRGKNQKFYNPMLAYSMQANWGYPMGYQMYSPYSQYGMNYQMPNYPYNVNYTEMMKYYQNY